MYEDAMDEVKKDIEDRLTGNNPSRIEKLFKIAQSHYEQEMYNPPIRYNLEVKERL